MYFLLHTIINQNAYRKFFFPPFSWWSCAALVIFIIVLDLMLCFLFLFSSQIQLIYLLCVLNVAFWRFIYDTTQGDHEGSAVIISWITPDEPGSNTLLYWADNIIFKTRVNGIVLTYKYFKYTSGYITIKNLPVHIFSSHLINFHGMKVHK